MYTDFPQFPPTPWPRPSVFPLQLNAGGTLLELEQPQIVGILNLTPDSFSDGGAYTTTQAAVDQAGRLLENGADWLDLGAQSTRPGAESISVEQELERLLPPLQAIRQAFPQALIALDTERSAVVQAALPYGPNMLNDVSGGATDPLLASLAAQEQLPLVLMHRQGVPATMQQNPHYTQVAPEVKQGLLAALNKARSQGVKDLLLDPGFGFGKTLAHNHRLFLHLPEFAQLGFPLYVGLSRKSMLSKLLNRPWRECLPLQEGLHLQALFAGAAFVRVHDPAPVQQLVQLWRYWMDLRNSPEHPTNNA